ncbi:MAG: lysophospholipid acyltransferase family protein [Candidatus Omnitrophota bacterium]|nr:MAG: lysophospholipid acyltransferase family protein [Candidatus Omnitrophota bacterium]
MKIKTKRYYVYYFLKIAGFIVSILPVKVGLYLADFAGKAAFSVMKKERRRTLENLRNTFPEKTDAEIEAIAKGVFSNLCKNGVEWINIYKLNKKNIDLWVKGGDFGKIDRVFAKGKGGIMLASHFGNWELIHVCFLLKGYPGTVIARRIYFNKYDEFLNNVRAAKGVDIMYRDESPKKLLRLLKQNKLIGILADQDVDSVDGIFVDFFGRPAYTPKAPVAFSLASGAPLIPCFMVRDGNRHRLVIDEPLYMVEKSTREETIQFNTQRWSRLVESYIRKSPEQWVWMHRRWKTKPDEFSKK